MAQNRIPIYQPDLSGKEKQYVNDCLDSTWISSKGSYINRFETAFAEYVGLDHAASCSNGTTALHLALLALGIKPGDEVIVPTLTYIASVNAIVYMGAKPVFVDSLPDTWQMDPEDIKQKITERTRAIMAVHLYGHPCDMDSLAALAKDHSLLLIEDCAEAIGTQYKGRHVGQWGDVATFSFFGNKTITTGEGGMVLSSRPEVAESARHFRGQGLADNREYWHDVVGYNYRMTNICAALGLAQLERVDAFLADKRAVAQAYQESLKGLPVECHSEHDDMVHSYWMCSILTEKAEDRNELRDFLKEQGIETRPVFYPIHTMPMYAGGDQHPIADDLAARGISLPSWPGLGEANIARISGAIREYYAAK